MNRQETDEYGKKNKVIRQLPSVTRPDSRTKLSEGRTSVDSAYYDNQSIDDGEEQTDNEKNIHLSSNKWIALVDIIREKRRKRREEDKEKGVELDLLKASLEKAIVKSRSLEGEVVPVKEKLQRYQDLITELENKVLHRDEESLHMEKLYNEKMLKLEKQKQSEINNETLKNVDALHSLKEQNRQLEIKNQFLTKDLFESKSNLTVRTGSSQFEDDVPTKQLANLKTELLNIRQILDSSEQERLKERKEKLATLQNMIVLTKQKSDLEEELHEVQRNNTQENSMKYIRLFDKYEACVAKLKKLETNDINERTELQKKYLTDVRDLENKYEETLREVDTKHKTVETALESFKTKKKKNAHEVLEELNNSKDDASIILALEEDGIYEAGSSGKQLLLTLFSRYKDLCRKFETSDEILTNMGKSNIRPVIETLKEEKRILKRKIEDCENALTGKESELRITQVSLKQQIDELLNEKKKLMLECKKHGEDADGYQDEMLDLKEQLVLSKELLSKRTVELAMLRDNLSSVTNEMKSVDGDLGKTKRDLAIRDAEITRFKQDMILEQKMLTKEKALVNDLKIQLEEKKIKVEENTRIILSLEDKIKQVEETLEATKLHAQRASTERDQVKKQMVLLKNEDSVKAMKIRQLEDALQSLKSQISNYEDLQKQKTESLSSYLIEIDRLKVELLATQHLLSEEENKVIEYENDIESLSLQIENKSNLYIQLDEENQHLKNELQSIKSHTMSTGNDLLSKNSLVQKNVRSSNNELDPLSPVKSLQNLSKQDNPVKISNQLHDLTEEKNRLQQQVLSLNDQLQSLRNEKQTEIESLKNENAELGKEIKEATNMISALEEPLQEAVVQTEVEMSAFAYDDFIVLDEKPSTTQSTTLSNSLNSLAKKSSSKQEVKQKYISSNIRDNVSNKQPQLVNEGLQNEVEWLMQESQPIMMDEKASPEARLNELETEKDQLWNDSLQKEITINTLKSQLERKENEKRNLEDQLKKLEEKVILLSKNNSKKNVNTKGNNNENFKRMQDQLDEERREKDEAMDCLKALVVDNETLSNIVKEQHTTITKQRKENQDLEINFNHTLDTLHDNEDSLMKTKVKLRNVMQTSLTRESNISVQQKQEIDQLKKDLELLRDEKRQLHLDLDDKSYEVRKTQDDLNTLRSALEYNLGSMDAEKRSKEFIEDQLKLIQQDRGHTLQKLQSTELLNKILQNKLVDLQKWHNDLEINLLKSRDFEALPLDLIKANQISHNDFIENQLNVVNNKLYEVETHDKNKKNLYNSLTKNLGDEQP